MQETSPSVWWFAGGTLGQAIIRLETSLAHSSWADLGAAMGSLQRECEALELRSATAQLRHITSYISEVGVNGTNAELRRLVLELMQRVMDEFDGQRFLVLSPSERAAFDPDGPPFGNAVDDAFPSASYDISEASKCLGLGRATASVMHLMRALEPALVALQHSVGVEVPKTQWDQILNQVEAKIRSINKHTHSAADEQWYSEAATHFRLIKNAWRNHAMHGHETYDLERATTIMGSVRQFMQHLATRLRG